MINIKKIDHILNYSSQIYLALLGLLTTPFLFRLLGSSGYGIIGAYNSISSILAFLDLGLGALLAKNWTAINAGKELSENINSIRFSACWFLTIATVIFLVSIFYGKNIYHIWFVNNGNFDDQSVVLAGAFSIIGICLGLRWLVNLSRMTLVGLAEFRVISILTIIFATLKTSIVFYLLFLESKSQLNYFYLLLILSILEVIFFLFYAIKSVPVKNLLIGTIHLKEGMKATIFPSILITICGITTICIQQADKILMSKLLPLNEFGIYMALVSIATSMFLFTSPVTMPMMTQLNDSFLHKDNAHISIFTKYQAVLVGLVSTFALVIVVFSRFVASWWLGSDAYQANYSYLLIYFTLGNACFISSASSYYLLLASGKLKFQIFSNLIVIALFFPVYMLIGNEFTLLRGAMCWFYLNIILAFIIHPIILSISKFRKIAIFNLLIITFCTTLIALTYFIGEYRNEIGYSLGHLFIDFDFIYSVFYLIISILILYVFIHRLVKTYPG